MDLTFFIHVCDIKYAVKDSKAVLEEEKLSYTRKKVFFFLMRKLSNRNKMNVTDTAVND